MARRDQWTRHAALQAARDLASTPALARVRYVAKIHARSTSAGTCPCCGSPTAKIVDEYDDLDLLLNLDEGTRWLRALPPNTRGAALLQHQVPSDVGLFDELAADADVTHTVLLRVASHCVDLVFDASSTTLLAGGAARSTKTQHGCVWMARQLGLRGGPGKLFLLAGPSVEQAFIPVDKLVVGEGEDNPPILPAGLVVRRPTMTETTPTIELLDGTRIRVRHTATSARLGGRRYEAIQWTEASGTTSREGDAGKDAYTQLRGRIVSSRGQMYLDAVPKRKSWVVPTIINVARDEDEAETRAVKKGEPFTRTVRVQHLSSVDNPWLDEAEAVSFRNDLYRVDPKAAAREADGLWTGDATEFFADLFDGAAHTYEYEGWADVCEFLGLRDATRQASLRWFRDPREWIAGVDINANPHSAIVAKIAVPKDADDRDPDAWILLPHAVFQTWRDPTGRAFGDRRANDSAEAAKLLATEHDGIFAGAGVIMDATSSYRGHNAGGVTNANRNAIPREDYERAGFEVRGPDRWHDGERNFKNPSVPDSAAVVRRMLRDNRVRFNRLHGGHRLVNAVREVESDETGTRPSKERGTDQDRYIASLIDCWRYLAWPFWKRKNA
jgi:hypothetical protein